MQFQDNTTNLSTHTFLDFETDGGILSVNASRQQVVVKYGDLSFGKGTFAMDVAHIYSSCSHIANSSFGRGWKLNIEQYVIPYQSSMGLKDFKVGDYVYIDGNGSIHRFVYYDVNRYYDADGSSMVLDTSNGLKKISFPNDSYLNFYGDGRLFEYVVKGKSRNIIKRISYDTSGKISKYYDSRCSNAKERYVGFEYENSLLKRMYLYANGREQESLYYKYNFNTRNLCGIFHFVNQKLAIVSYFGYDDSNRLVELTGTPNGNGAKLIYSVSNITIKQGIMKILLGSSTPEIGKDTRSYISLDEKQYLNDDLYLFAGDNDLDDFSKTLSRESMTELDSITFTYNTIYTDVKNSKQVTYRYYFNTAGEITSQFEVVGNALRTLHKESGYSAMNRKQNDYTGLTINQRGIVSREIGKGFSVINSDEWLDNELKGRNYETYRKKYCYYYIHLKVGFFLKHNCTNATYMTASFSFLNNNKRFKETVHIDFKATNAWQYVEIPFSQENNPQMLSYGISSGSIQIDSDGSGNYEISDIRFDGTSRYFLYLTSYGNFKELKNYYSVTLEKTNGSRETILLSGKNYITNSDIQLDWLLMKKETSAFDFVYCNGTKRIPNVKSVTFRPSGEANLEYNFDIIKQVNKDVLDQQSTESFSVYNSGLITTYTETTGEFLQAEDERDLQGKVIYSIDYYGKKTVNEYDQFGNLLSTIIAKKDDFDSNNKVIQGRKRLYLLYNYVEDLEEFRENVKSIKNEESSIEFAYDDATLNQCHSMKTNDNIQTNYIYDCINRVCEIPQESQRNHISFDPSGNIKSLCDNNSYGYEFDNTTTKSTVSMKCKSSTFKQTLSETNVDYNNNSTKVTDSMLNTYVLTNYNKYGQPTRYCFDSSSQNMNITYQEIGDVLDSDGLTNYFDESLSIAEIKKITCPFTNNTYEFSYDNANQLKEYKMSNGSNQLLSVHKENTLSSKYNIGDITYVTTKEYNSYPNQKRIKKTKIGASSDSDFSKFTYSYDYHPILGTITKKTGGNTTTEISYEANDGANYYSTNPQQVTQITGGKTFKVIYNYNQNGDIIKTYGYNENAYMTSSYSYDSNHRIEKEGYINLNKDYRYEYNEYNRISKVYQNGSLYKNFTYDTLGRLTNVQKNGISFRSYQYIGDSLYPNNINNSTCKFKRNGLLYTYGFNTYEYDYNGLRYSKITSSNTTIKYYYLGDRLLGEDYSNGIQLRYMYDQEGITGVRYYAANGTVTEYEYVKDGYQNVIGIVKDSQVVAKYVYDAWGNIIREEKDSNDPFARMNPIRYRSYYYDIETGFYYLQTRYYDPEIGAFISPDSVDYLDSVNIGGLNLYTYCGNNPIGISYRGLSVGMLSSIRGNLVNKSTISGGSGKINWSKTNSVFMTNKVMFSLIENPKLGGFLGNFTYRVTKQHNSAETFYKFSNIGTDDYVGRGVNFGNWYGYNVYLSGDYGFGSSWQLTPWLTGSSGWSVKDGLFIGVGFIDGNKTHEVTVSVGNGVLAGYAACALVAALPIPGAKVVAGFATCIIFVVNLFK